MARTPGSFILGGTLEIQADAPADARLQVKTLQDLTAPRSFPYKYIGMVVSVESEQKAYMLVNSDTTQISSWQEQGASVDSYTKSEVDELLSEVSDTIDSTSTAQSEVDNTQNNTLTSLSAATSELNSSITSLSTSQSEIDSAQNTNISSLTTQMAGKQDTLTAGPGISIVNGVISVNQVPLFQIVEELPTEDISVNLIYLVPNEDPEVDNLYDEWIYANNNWEHIGSFTMDLTNYYDKSEVDSLLAVLSEAQDTINSMVSASITSLTAVDTSMSLSMSELALTASSLSTENSTQTVSINSLTSETSTMSGEVDSMATATSELDSNVTELGSEVADLSDAVAEKQDKLIAGEGIAIDEDENIIKATGAIIYANPLFPSGE